MCVTDFKSDFYIYSAHNITTSFTSQNTLKQLFYKLIPPNDRSAEEVKQEQFPLYLQLQLRMYTYNILVTKI